MAPGGCLGLAAARGGPGQGVGSRPTGWAGLWDPDHNGAPLGAGLGTEGPVWSRVSASHPGQAQTSAPTLPCPGRCPWVGFTLRWGDPMQCLLLTISFLFPPSSSVSATPSFLASFLLPAGASAWPRSSCHPGRVQLGTAEASGLAWPLHCPWDVPGRPRSERGAPGRPTEAARPRPPLSYLLLDAQVAVGPCVPAGQGPTFWGVERERWRCPLGCCGWMSVLPRGQGLVLCWSQAWPRTCPVLIPWGMGVWASPASAIIGGTSHGEDG